MNKKDQSVNKESSGEKTNTYMVLGSKFELEKRYEIIDPVGSGAYGVVVAAKDNEADEAGKLVAIKKIEKVPMAVVRVASWMRLSVSVVIS